MARMPDGRELHLHKHEVSRLPQVVRMPWMSKARPHSLRGPQPAVSAVSRIEVCFPIGGIALAGAAQGAEHSAPSGRERCHTGWAVPAQASQDALGNLQKPASRRCGPTGAMALWGGRRPRAAPW
jgi:hypothetical protein